MENFFVSEFLRSGSPLCRLKEDISQTLLKSIKYV